MYMDRSRGLYHDLVMMQLYWGMTLIMAPAQAPKSSTPLTAGPCRGAFIALRLMPPTPFGRQDGRERVGEGRVAFYHLAVIWSIFGGSGEASGIDLGTKMELKSRQKLKKAIRHPK